MHRRGAIAFFAAVLMTGFVHVAAAQSLSVTLERGACFGTCPVYVIGVSDDGKITYSGHEHVAQIGERTATLSAQKMHELADVIDFTRFDDLGYEYRPGTQGCERHSTDLPTQTITVVRNGKEKRVVYNMGCHGGSRSGDLDRLVHLGEAIDKILDSARWTDPRPQDE